MEVPNHAGSRPERLDRPAGRGGPRDADRPIVLDQEVDPPAVGGPRKIARRAIQAWRHHARGSARRGNHGNRWSVVEEVLRRAALQVRDRPAIRAPRRRRSLPRLVVGPFPGRELAGRRARARIDQVDVPVLVPVGVAAALARECDRGALRRPGRQAVVKVAPRQLVGLLARQVEQVEMVVEVDQVALHVLLELIAVNHDRRRRLLLRGRGGHRFGLRIGCDERQPLAVGRPDEVGDAARQPRELPRLATRPGHRPDLGLRAVAACRQEREQVAVRAPARLPLALPRVGELDPLGAVPPDHPEVARHAVVLDVGGADDIGNPRAVRGNLRVAHFADGGEIVEGEPPRRRLAVRRGRCRERDQNHRREGRHLPGHAPRPFSSCP